MQIIFKHTPIYNFNSNSDFRRSAQSITSSFAAFGILKLPRNCLLCQFKVRSNLKIAHTPRATFMPHKAGGNGQHFPRCQPHPSALPARLHSSTRATHHMENTHICTNTANLTPMRVHLSVWGVRHACICMRVCVCVVCVRLCALPASRHLAAILRKC